MYLANGLTPTCKGLIVQGTSIRKVQGANRFRARFFSDALVALVAFITHPFILFACFFNLDFLHNFSVKLLAYMNVFLLFLLVQCV